VRKIAVDQELLRKTDEYFSVKLKEQKITDQKSTGRCWMFAGLNILRPQVIARFKLENFEFSQSFLFFYDKLEKANLFLQTIDQFREKPMDDRYLEFFFRSPVADGGWWVGMVELIRKYGLVPQEIMPETFSSSNSASVNRALELKLKEYGLALRRENSEAIRQELKVKALKDVYRILALHFGVPPREFRWRYEDKDKKLTPYQTYTPQRFYRDAVGVDLDQYYAICSIANRAYDTLYAIDFDRAVFEKPDLTFVNCPIEALKDMAKASLLDKQPVWFGCDVSKDFIKDSGLLVPEAFDLASLYGMEFKLSRRDLFDTYSTMPTHAMVFTGVDIVDNKTKKWLVENSWGDKAGQKGYLHMLDEWFGEYVQAVIIHKKYIPEKILAIFSQKPQMLPPWDPMFLPLL
jgi:bleomycin hydrolase